MDVQDGENSLSQKDKVDRERCGFYVKRKRRNCRMLPAKGNKYCAEHLCFQDDQFSANRDDLHKGNVEISTTVKKRVQCPLDPKHTVFEDRLEKHLKKCNSRGKTQQDYFEEHIHSGLLHCETAEDEKVPLNKIPKMEIYDLIKRVEKCYSESLLKIKKWCGSHPVLKEELDNEEYGESTRKHFLQQASLIDLLEKNDVFKKDKLAVLEFGAGKGKLSHWLQKAVGNVDNVEYYLIDRQNHRHKFDCFHRGENQGPSFKRLYIDIEHLNLAKVSDLTQKNIVGIGKHLCGAATDFSLRCLAGGDRKQAESNQASKKAKLDHNTNRIELILFALCCYHKCSWPSFVGRDFFAANGFNKTDFHRITKICSWAVCGVRSIAKDSGDDELLGKEKDEMNTFQLNPEQKKEIGSKCKRLIDLGRIEYLRKHGYQTELIYFIDSAVTLENVVLLAKPNITNG
ncbi:tRNA:m(4)X modification enzyme TRM13 homolog isoform X2 [Rhopilema esculentum]|uniref:tRNA:m(4)X modification enzyme TRM13 homolog isoform X2 n=1 Tax=Rhopilema esculentum TaxID=499914 RepID=UPI0031DE45B4